MHARWSSHSKASMALVVALGLSSCGDGPTSAERSMGYAAYDGDAERVLELLDGGVDPDALSDSGYPFITEAAAGGHPGVMQILLDAGADPNALTSNGDTAFAVVANDSGSVAAAMWLVGNGVDPCVPPSAWLKDLMGVTSWGQLTAIRNHTDLASYLWPLLDACGS